MTLEKKKECLRPIFFYPDIYKRTEKGKNGIQSVGAVKVYEFLIYAQRAILGKNNLMYVMVCKGLIGVG